MSSSSNRPYKSRFFNFLNRYSIKVKDQAGVAWRKAAQTSVEWSLQILLYPIYFIVQAGRFAQRQLKQGVRKVPRLIASRLRNEKPSVELLPPTERVLEAIQFTLPQENTANADFLARLSLYQVYPQDPFCDLQQSSTLTLRETDLKIQGIVSLLEDHRLALVIPNNTVLDLFTDEQQETLEDRIRLELANYWYEARLRVKEQRKTPGLMPSFRKTWSNVLPPIRWFWQIMRWEQTSDIAKEINLFGESSLVPIEPTSTELFPSPILIRLDEKLAIIEEQDFISLTQWIQRTLTQTSVDLSNSQKWKVQVLIRAAIAYFFGTKLQELTTSNDKSFVLPGTEQGQKILAAVKDKSSNWLYAVGDRLNESLPEPSTDPESDPFKIQNLIKSGLSYYLAQEQATPQALPAAPEPPESDPWLNWNDIFAPTSEINQSSLEPEPVASLPPASPVKPKPSNQPQIKSTTPKPISKIAPKLPSIDPVASATPPVEQKRPEIVHQPFPTSYDNNADQDWPDWVEIKATSTGYEKHFLERILDGFDQIMLWIEDFLIKIWQWLRGRKRNRNRHHR